MAGAAYVVLGSIDPTQERLLHNEIALNLAWLVLSAVLVIFMQAGFAMVETGFTRAKNSSHVVLQNFTVFALSLIGYFVLGFGLQFSFVELPVIGIDEPIGREFAPGGFGLFSIGAFFMSGAYDPSVLALFLFQMAFMDTAATIPTGAMAERWRFSAFIVWGLFCGALYFPLYGNWVWGGGWLSTLGVSAGLGNGVVDFAGSGVVHGMGGIAALTGAYVLGPRMGKYGRDGKPRAIPGHNIPMALLGTFILLIGWFGFNAGSTFAATDLRFAVIATNTAIAAATGTCSAMATSYLKVRKPDPSFIANGMLAGLVAITASCAFVAPWAAFVIGAIAGVLVVYAILWVDRTLRVDDPVGAIAVHCVCGLFGVLAVGIFADGTYGVGYNGVEGVAPIGILYGAAGFSQLAAQLIACVVIIVFGGGFSYAFFRIQQSVMAIRSRRSHEQIGLDVEEIGVLGYADFVILSDAESPNGQPDPQAARPDEGWRMPDPDAGWRR